MNEGKVPQGLSRMALYVARNIKCHSGLATILEPAIPTLVDHYRQAPVKHADETGWRTDGKNGYAWLFATPLISIFRFRNSRAAAVAQEVFGSQSQAGAKTRETLMTILHTLKKQQANPGLHLKKVLDQLAMNPDQNVYALLFGNSS